MASDTDHRLKILQERLANISNNFKGELIKKRYERKQKHPTLQEDLKSEPFHSVSDEKIFQKVKPNWESWKYIPKENLNRLKKKTLGHIFQNKQ